MILHIEGPDETAIHAARRRVDDLATSWGSNVTEVTPRDLPGDAQKVLEPISLTIAATSLLLSIPSALLAVADLSDRRNKRKRAEELIREALSIEWSQGKVYLVEGHHLVRLATAAPDEILAALVESTGPTSSTEDP